MKSHGQQSWPRALPGLNILNFGLIGAGPQQYLRVYKTFGRHLHSKVVLVGLFVRNDFWDAELFNRWLRSGVSGNYMVWRDFGRRKKTSFDLRHPRYSTQCILSEMLSGNSYLYKILQFTRSSYRSWPLSELRVLRYADGNHLELRPHDFSSKTTSARPEHPVFQLALEALERIHSITRKQGAHVLVVFQSSKEEVYMPLLGEPAADPGVPLRAALDRLDIDYLDLTPAFYRRAKTGERLFFQSDDHPNRQGYRLIAEEVVARLKERGFHTWIKRNQAHQHRVEHESSVFKAKPLVSRH